MWNGLFFLFFFVPFTLIQSFAAIIGSLFDGSGRFAHGCARIWSLVALVVARTPLTVEGMEYIPEGQPVIFMGNHQGNFDILALTQAIPRRFSWLAKEELFRVPFFGRAMLRAGYIPINRGDGRRALKSIDTAAARIRSGTSVVVFPEGTRSRDGRLGSFKRGGFVLASRAGVPVVPFAIQGSYEINPPDTIELHPRPVVVRFGAPIMPGAKAERDELPDRVRAAIEELLQ